MSGITTNYAALGFYGGRPINGLASRGLGKKKHSKGANWGKRSSSGKGKFVRCIPVAPETPRFLERDVLGTFEFYRSPRGERCFVFREHAAV